MTTENNKIIREFHPKMKVDNGIGELTEVENLRVKCLRYSSDWNWLMEVVEKILTVGDNTDQWDNVLNELQTVNIRNVYNACVEFIKWYNEQKK